MRRRLTEWQQAVLFIVAVSLAIAVVYGLVLRTQAPPVAPSGFVHLGLIIEGEDWTIRYLDVRSQNNTAFGILLEAASRFAFEVRWTTYAIPEGVFVTAINGTANGHAGKFWQYWVNDEYGAVAADRHALVDGDLVRWALDISREAT